MTDRLSLTNALTDANIDRQKAERIATEIFDAIHDNVATKQDIARLEAATKQEITRLEAATKQEIARLEAATKQEITRLEAAMREMELRLDQRIDRMGTRLGSLMVVLLGLLFAALHYWPPHG
jgi:hypothetical protein